MMNKIYCYHCDKEVDVRKVEVEESATFKGTTFVYQRYNLICDVCGEEVYDYENEKRNSILKADAYRKAVGLLTSEEIKSIRLKYNCSQVAFARILCLGDKAIAKYETGTIQDAQVNAYITLMRDGRNFYNQKMKAIPTFRFDIPEESFNQEMVLKEDESINFKNSNFGTSLISYKNKKVNELIQIA